MAGQRLTDKSALTQQPASDDELMIVDVSDTTGSAQGTSKRIQAHSLFTVKSISLSSAQIQALHTTPIELIAAPGSGYAIMVHSIAVDAIYGTTTEANKRGLIFAYGTPGVFPPPAINVAYIISDWMHTAGSSRTYYAHPNDQGVTSYQSGNLADNQPWKVAASAAIAADFTAVVHIAYTKIKL